MPRRGLQANAFPVFGFVALPKTDTQRSDGPGKAKALEVVQGDLATIKSKLVIVQLDLAAVQVFSGEHIP